MKPTRKQLLKAIRWALGEDDEFRMREEGEGLFWWRKELRRRAGFPIYVYKNRTIQKESSDDKG